MNRPRRAPDDHAEPATLPPASGHVYGEGRRKLLDAAATLAARHGHSQFSLRELAKEAGLGHNTIYRHFDSVEAMMPCLVDEFCLALRAGLAEARQRVPPGHLPTRTVMNWLLDFAAEHRDAFVVSMRERHAPSGEARASVEAVMQDIRQDMLDQLSALGHLPSPPPPQLSLAMGMVSEQSFQYCLEYIWHPERREDILARAELGFAWITQGALASMGNQSR
jgi:TetR/AcrR family transcriptional regulator, fatty acid biosynthesis regulator